MGNDAFQVKMVQFLQREGLPVVALSSLARIVGRMFDHSYPACTFLGVIFEVDISSRTLIPSFMPGSVHSGSAS